MTLHEVSSQLYSLSVSGYFNREKFSKAQFSGLMNAMFKGGGQKYIGEIALPDGWWNFKVFHYGTKKDQFDYIIAEDKAQNESLYSELVG